MLGRFHRYSAANVLRISLQRPNATRVAGYGTWKRLGRQVRRGEKAIRILAPIVFRDRTGDKEAQDKDEETTVGFRPAFVFDVSQTDGKPLLEFTAPKGDPLDFLPRLEGLIARMGITLKRTEALRTAVGASTGGQILLRQNLEPAEAFSTLVHELAHERLHQPDGEEMDRTARETEAEAVAFVVCEAVGIEARQASADYIHLYDGDKDTLREHLERIRATSVEILTGIQDPSAYEDAAGTESRGAPHAEAA